MTSPFGNLPYGYNPFSSSMLIPDDGWSGAKWNLADAQVRSQMTLPLFANMGSLPGAMMNQYPVYQRQDSGDFYNNLLLTQSLAGGATPQSQSGQNTMMDLFQMMMTLKYLDKISNNSKTTTKSESADDEPFYVDPDDEEESDAVSDGDDEVKTFDFKKDKNALSKFIKSDDDEAELKYGDIDKFVDSTYKSIQDKHKGHVTLRETMNTFGVDWDDLSKKQKDNLKKLTNPTEKATNIGDDFADDDIFLCKNTYKSILNKLGLNDDNNSISKEDLKNNIEALTKNSEESLAGAQGEKDKKQETITKNIATLSDKLNQNGDYLRADNNKIHAVFKKDGEDLLALLKEVNANKFNAPDVKDPTDFLTAYVAGVSHETTDNRGAFNRDVLPLLKEIQGKIDKTKDKALKEKLQEEFDTTLDKFSPTIAEANASEGEILEIKASLNAEDLRSKKPTATQIAEQKSNTRRNAMASVSFPM